MLLQQNLLSRFRPHEVSVCLREEKREILRSASLIVQRRNDWLTAQTNSAIGIGPISSLLSLSVLINLVRTSKGADLIVGAIERVPDSGVLPGMHAMCRHVVSSFNTGKTWGQI